MRCWALGYQGSERLPHTDPCLRVMLSTRLDQLALGWATEFLLLGYWNPSSQWKLARLSPATASGRSMCWGWKPGLEFQPLVHSAVKCSYISCFLWEANCCPTVTSLFLP